MATNLKSQISKKTRVVKNLQKGINAAQTEMDIRLAEQAANAVAEAEARAHLSHHGSVDEPSDGENIFIKCELSPRI